MNSTRTLLLALALATTPALALAAKWEKVGDAGRVAVWVDKDTVRRNGNEVRAWLEWRWVQPTDVPDADPPRQYRLERQVQISNCSNKSYAVAEGTRYADERGLDPVSSYKHDESALPYSVAPPRTIRETVVTWVCAAAPPAKKP